MGAINDLSQEIYTNHPVYHTYLDTVIWTDTSHDDTEHMFRKQLVGEDPPFTFETSVIQLCDHGPTHVNAETTIEDGDTVLIRTGHYEETYLSREYAENHSGLNEVAILAD